MDAGNSLCLRTMLDDGIPSQEALDELLKKIDNQLSLNTKQLEMCVGDMTSYLTHLPGCKGFDTSCDVLEYIAANHVIEKTGCIDPDPEKINALLRHVIQLLDKQPGCEEAIVDNLLLLSSEEGIILPMIGAYSSVEEMTESRLSINTVPDTNEQITESLWASICSRIRNYFIAKLKALPLVVENFIINHEPNRRLRYLQSLCSFCVTGEVWNRYKSLRVQQVDMCLGNLIIDNQGNKKSFDEIVATFDHLSATVISMINEDFVILCSNTFSKDIKTFHTLHDMFLVRISDELSVIVDIIHENLVDISQPKTLTPSKSEVGLFKPTSMRRTHSKSLDSLLCKSADDNLHEDYATRVFIKTLTQMILSIFAIECHIENLYRRMTWELIPGKGDKKHLKSSLKESRAGMSPRKGLINPSDSDDMSSIFLRQEAMMHMDDEDHRPGSSTLRVVEKLPHQDKPLWEWRSIISKLIPGTAKLVEQIITETATYALAEELSHIEEHHTVPTEQVCEMMFGGKLDYPRFIAKSVARLCRQLDKLLPLAAIGVDKVFHLLRSSFAECSMLQLKNCHLHLNKICTEVARQRLPHRCTYIALASAAFIRNHLLHYDSVLTNDGDNGKKIFGVLYRQFCELVESISRQIVEYHNALFATSILQDAESHDWLNLKEFYEGERCSFSIQMWNLHMTSLQHDLWYSGPPRLAQSMFCAILQESLLVLSGRYAHIKPTFQRTKQMRRDIVTLLHCMSQFVFSAFTSISRLLDSTRHDGIYFSLHNCCNSLLASMAIVSSPLDVIYKVYKRGYLKKRTWENSNDPDPEEPPIGRPCDWLCFVQPGIYSKECSDVDDMQTTTALYLQLKLLSRQPEPHWPMLLEALVMKDYTLSIMLLNARLQSVGSRCDIEGLDPTPCGMVCCTGQSCLSRQDTNTINCFIPFVTVLMKLPMSPDAVTKIIMPVIERTEAWSLFDMYTIPGRSVQVPDWLEAIFSALKPFVSRVIEPALQILLTEYKPVIEPFWSHMTQLPCGCKPLHCLDNFRSNVRSDKGLERDVIGDALQALILQLVDDVYSLPGPLCLLFRAIEQKIIDKDITNTHKCLGLQILACCVRDMLANTCHISTMTGLNIDGQLSENLTMLSECSYFIISMQTKRREGNIPRRASEFFKKYRYWVADKLENVIQYLKKDLYTSEDCVLDGATADFREQYMISLCDVVLKSPEGYWSMIQIFNLLMNNLSWILHQLDIPHGFTPKHENPASCFADFKPCSLSSFNPIERIDMMGDYIFSHEMIENVPIDWFKLVRSDLGLSEIAFRTLLYNRHDMQENAFLEENEKKPIQNLRAMYDPDSTDA